MNTPEDNENLKRKIYQIRESKSSLNRYYFWIRFKRQPLNDGELMLFYIESGGARDYAERNKNATIKES